jgi:hypothetical protein
MPVYHRTRRLQIYGDKPEVTTLFGNRYQMVVRCEAKHDTEAWYNSNKSQIFADFGTLYDAEMAIDGIEPRTGEAYDNMVLVSNEASYTRTGEYIVTFVYQTLTADFVQEAADKVDYELNGLRRVTRPLIAKDGSDYYNVPDAMVVEDAGTESFNEGVYVRDGNAGGNSRPKYTDTTGEFNIAVDGDPESVAPAPEKYLIFKVVTTGTGGLVDPFVQTFTYYYKSSTSNTSIEATPDLVATWNTSGDGTAPAPTVRRATWADIEAAGIDPSTVPVLAGSEKVVGTSTISHAEHGYDTETLTLASAVEDAKGPNEGGYVRIVETWVEAGTLSESFSNNTSGLPNTKTRSVTSIGVEPTSNGILLTKSQQNQSGFITYNYTFLEGSSGGDPTDGVLQSYETVIEVQKPGTIEGSVINQVAEIIQVPPSVGKVIAKVDISLTTSSTATIPVAYNLDGVSCSATFTQTRVTPVGVEQGASITAVVFNTRRTANVRPFPNHYRIGSGISNSYSTPATVVRDDDNIIGESFDETLTTAVVLTGSATEPETTGIYDEQVEPAFLDDSGTQYYRKTTYTIPSP